MQSISHARSHVPATWCDIAPPFVLLDLVTRGNAEQKAVATRTLVRSAEIRARRVALTAVLRESGARLAELGLVAGEHLTVYDAGNGTDLPGTRVRGDGDPESSDDAVNQAFDGADKTYEFYQQVYGRDSVDGQGLELVSTVHYDTDFDNAFWDGSQMVYGDGSGQIFQVGGLTRDIDVMAHELTHGVTQFTAGLIYSTQSGALNESMSDVFGSLVKQYTLGQTADQADWLIGEGILGSALNGTALRSMAAPGTAFDGDRQPADMDGYVNLPDDGNPAHDHGGVHINSGIPNHAFFLVATSLGGNAWERAGQIWYDTLTGGSLPAAATFAQAARATLDAAAQRYGDGSTEQQAVQDAWQQVKVI